VKKGGKMKRLVIIPGVTGTIGNIALMAYGSKKNTIIYGISRQAMALENFINEGTGKFHCSTFACSLSGTKKSYREFVNLIDFKKFSEVICIHALGVYPFEINEKGEHVVQNDLDGDGIDDRCTLLSYDVFRWITSEIIKKTKIPIKFVTFGGLADEHKPKIIDSWWQTMEKVRSYMKKMADNRIGMYKFNISSVFCPQELLRRPFVFVNTKAEHRRWLSPTQLAKNILKELKNNGGYHEFNIYNHWKKLTPDYYSDERLTERRLKELYK
jgi:hypothetical protein